MAVNYGQVAIVPKGVWNAETQYKVNNLVEYDGSSYVAKVQPPVGTLPTDISYWQVSAAGTKKATPDSLGTVMPDGTTTEIKEDGKLSAKTAQQNALGVVKGSDDITVGEDGKLSVNTAFKQATELANIIAGEAIKSVLGKVSKAIATTMSLDENALLKNMISGIDVNDSNKVPSSAYIHTLVERIGMGTELASGLGDLTTGLNTVNNNLSKMHNLEIATKDLNTGLNGRTLCIDGNNIGKALSGNSYYLAIMKNGRTKLGLQGDRETDVVWYSDFATKDDLPNIYGVQFDKNNEAADHVQTIKNVWDKFPNNQPFVCTLADANQCVIIGFVYSNRRYGAVLYLAFNSCGIVKCNGGTFSDVKL